MIGKKLQNKGKLIESRMISATEQDFLDTNKKLTETIFKDKDEITLSEFLDMKRSLQNGLLHYEFHQYDTDENDTISASDFALSLLSTLTFGQATRYHKRIEKIDLPGRVSFEEFVAFQRFTAKSDIIKMKIATWRFLNFEMM